MARLDAFTLAGEPSLREVENCVALRTQVLEAGVPWVLKRTGRLLRTQALGDRGLGPRASVLKGSNVVVEEGASWADKVATAGLLLTPARTCAGSTEGERFSRSRVYPGEETISQ